MAELKFTIEEVFELLQTIHLDENSDTDLLSAYKKLHNIEIKEEK
tara:strand:+ start:224 stop:358 length:135 start_codon:yes stop_codon:yes gene_type:complete